MNKKQRILVVVSGIIVIVGVAIIAIQNFKTVQPVEKNTETNHLVYGQPYKVVWRENVYDPAFKEEISKLKVNQEFINKAPENVKAIIALYGYNYGNECEWDGKPTDKRDNLKCTVNAAVGVGYQCSDVQLELLQKYFPNEGNAKNTCATTPNSATFQDILDEVIIIQTKKDTFEIQYKHSPFNAREMLGGGPSEIKPLVSISVVDMFQFMNDYFTRIKK